MATKYHINPETGRANICRAEYNCKFGNVKHYDSKEAAIKGAEFQLEAEHMDVERVSDYVSDSMIFKSEMDFNIVDYHWDYAFKYPRDWSQRDKENLLVLKEVVEVLDKKKNPSEKDYENVKKKISEMYSEPYRYSSNIPEPRENHLKGLAKAWVAKKKWEDFETPVAPERVKDSPIIGLEQTQLEGLRSFSTYGQLPRSSEKDLEPVLNRLADGQSFVNVANDGVAVEDYKSIMPRQEILMAALTGDEGNSSNNQLYLSVAFPERELNDALKEHPVNSVSVSSFYNSREWGNAYTVVDPEGNTRTFSVYEHRNTDSIIINGKKNWDPAEGLPYAADNKNGFFAEFAFEDKKAAADTLVYFMREAEKGELPDDDVLVGTAEHRDWRSILSDSVPGFKDWADKNFPDDEKKNSDDPRFD